MQTGDEILKEENLKASRIINTGYSELDERIKLLRIGELTLLLGRPSMGKTMTALNVAAHVLSEGYEVCYISLEESKEDIVKKIIETKQINRDQLKRFYVSDVPYSALRARELRDLIKEKYPDARLIVFDYIQLIGSDFIQWLYDSFPDAAVLILSQASRKVEERESHFINFDDIKNIDVLSPYLGTVVSIYREDYYSCDEEPTNIMQVINLRTRQGTRLRKDGYGLFPDDY